MDSTLTSALTLSNASTLTPACGYSVPGRIAPMVVFPLVRPYMPMPPFPTPWLPATVSQLSIGTMKALRLPLSFSPASLGARSAIPPGVSVFACLCPDTSTDPGLCLTGFAPIRFSGGDSGVSRVPGLSTQASALLSDPGRVAQTLACLAFLLGLTVACSMLPPWSRMGRPQQ